MGPRYKKKLLRILYNAKLGEFGFLIGHFADLFEPNSSWVAGDFIFSNMLAKLAGPLI